MSTLLIDEVGPATSIQDAGRFGAQRYGLGTAGAMDRFALAAANAIVGQPLDAAAIEIGPLGMKLTARDGPVRLAFCGADRAAQIAGQPLPRGESAVLAEGESLVLRAARGAVFSYLAVAGGLIGEPVFGSMSVHRRAGLGSPYPRPLAAGDRLDVVPARLDQAEQRLPQMDSAPGPIRVVLGPQQDYVTPQSLDRFFETEWTISGLSDRMGYRLEGEPLRHARGHNIVSDGIAAGHIQIPGNGLPLVLMADRGTTGGYPKIGAIITADLGRFAQTPAGSRVRFQPVGIAEAQEITRRYWREMQGLPTRVEPLSGGALSSELLLMSNLAGQAISAPHDATWG
jgi:biotin-dependent carboxylase-like uncharacterized protein